jgi:arsenate reductase
MTVKIYEYKGCGTCRKALKWLKAKGIAFERIAIREKPPSKGELKRMLKAYDGNLHALFNTSGGDYRAMNIKEKIAKLSKMEAIDLLAGNGNLVKRPFVMTKDGSVVGFNEAEWTAFFNL